MTVYYYSYATSSPVCYCTNGKDFYEINGTPFAYVINNYWYSYNDNSCIGWQKDKWVYSLGGDPLYYTT